MLRLTNLFAFIFCFSSYGQVSQKDTSLDGVFVTKNIAYKTDNLQQSLLDLYRPKNNQKGIGIVLVHGGGWVGGTRKGFHPMASALAKKGYLVANIDYRLATEAKFPAAVQDVKAAVRWMRTNALVNNINPNKIIGVGGSAGGHLVAMTALTGDTKLFETESERKVSSQLQAAVIMGSGVDQVARIEKTKDKYIRSAFLFFGPYPEKKEIYKLGSPITHISEKSPPILMIDGELDMPGERYIAFKKKLDLCMIKNDFKIVTGAGHADWNKAPFLSKYIELIDQFIIQL